MATCRGRPRTPSVLPTLAEYGSGNVPAGKYGTANVDELRDELLALSDMLAADHVILAGAMADRERTYWAKYNPPEGERVPARHKEADGAALAETVQVIEIRGDINSLITR